MSYEKIAMSPILPWLSMIKQAHGLASQARFDESLNVCQQILDHHQGDQEALLNVAKLLYSYGFFSAARRCLARARKLVPGDPRPLINMADLAREAGDHAESRRLYTALKERLPDHPVIRRNELLSMEYDQAATDGERFDLAKKWGEWAVAKAVERMPQPLAQMLQDRPLRVGYVSADFCNHTVGLFVKDVIAAHDSERVKAFAYSAGQVSDWVTAAIKGACTLRNVSALDDATLAEQIRQDEIDVLVDLSGHTGGSRLMVFAHRPAPVQVSWLGYFATTGLPVMDAVLLDGWHAPVGTEAQFVERIIRLPGGRLCYTPVPFAPAVAMAPPVVKNGHVTFGCFNNTAKFNATVFDVWARILTAVPDARLVLKWRTFEDKELCQSVRDAFVRRGIESERVELRVASFHADVLNEYADIDIALDPFPFTGGMTSCESLWMGVPVVTWPQSRVVSRQTFAYLSAIGLAELAARDADDYVRIAVELATDRERLTELRSGMRQRMRTSPLMDVSGFTRELEHALIDLYQQIQQISKSEPDGCDKNPA